MGLDTVELVMAFEEAFGLEIDEAAATRMLTTRQATAWIYERVRSDLPEDQGCLSLRGFYRVRSALELVGARRAQIHLDAKVSALVAAPQRRDKLSQALEQAGLCPLRQLPFGLQAIFGRVRDVVSDAVMGQHALLRKPGHGWSRRQVCEVVRAVVFAQTARKGYSDDAKFVGDLGLD